MVAAMLAETAPAKLNLTLAVRGRRPDGYHELDSLVVFASVGDRVSLEPGAALSVETTGPFGAAITDDNLIVKAARAAQAAAPDLRLGHFRLEKNLPVAAGLGGGSSDAAAALRLISRTNPARAPNIDWASLAQSIGADVPVCLGARAARMSGLGERVEPLDRLPAIACVLANPRVPLATPSVFRALAAATFDNRPLASWPRLATADDLLAHVQAGRNDLQPAAIALCPPVADVLCALRSLAGAQIVRMSGSGPTCFALFRSRTEADGARAVLAARRPDWWVVSADLH